MRSAAAQLVPCHAMSCHAIAQHRHYLTVIAIGIGIGMSCLLAGWLAGWWAGWRRATFDQAESVGATAK